MRTFPLFFLLLGSTLAGSFFSIPNLAYTPQCLEAVNGYEDLVKNSQLLKFRRYQIMTPPMVREEKYTSLVLSAKDYAQKAEDLNNQLKLINEQDPFAPRKWVDYHVIHGTTTLATKLKQYVDDLLVEEEGGKVRRKVLRKESLLGDEEKSYYSALFDLWDWHTTVDKHLAYVLNGVCGSSF